jgi:preprotein translocase SecE subunit
MADKTTPKKQVDKKAKKVDNTVKNDSVEVANETTSQRKRRVLRATPEATSFREQSEKAQAKSSKPQGRSRFLSALATPFRFIGKLLARIFRPLGKFRFVRALGYVFAPPYIRNSWKELKQVTWPDRTQTRRLTFAVVLFSLVFGTIVAGVDFGLDKLFRTFILNK